jgi:hypothetical protein
MSNQPLGSYLNDHLAGATAGVELAEKLRQRGQGTELGNVMAGIHHDIEEDRAALEELMERLQVDRQRVKQAAGWVFEKLTRLRLDTPLTGDDDLTRLLELETLSLGIEGKLALWRSLKELAATDGRLVAADLERLIDRAEQQRQTLEPHRLAAARQAFSP